MPKKYDPSQGWEIEQEPNPNPNGIGFYLLVGAIIVSTLLLLDSFGFTFSGVFSFLFALYIDLWPYTKWFGLCTLVLFVVYQMMDDLASKIADKVVNKMRNMER